MLLISYVFFRINDFGKVHLCFLKIFFILFDLGALTHKRSNLVFLFTAL